MVQKIDEAGGNVEFLLFEDEGHGCRQGKNLKEEFGRELNFFDRTVLGD